MLGYKTTKTELKPSPRTRPLALIRRILEREVARESRASDKHDLLHLFLELGLSVDLIESIRKGYKDYCSQKIQLAEKEQLFQTQSKQSSEDWERLQELRGKFEAAEKALIDAQNQWDGKHRAVLEGMQNSIRATKLELMKFEAQYFELLGQRDNPHGGGSGALQTTSDLPMGSVQRELPSQPNQKLLVHTNNVRDNQRDSDLRVY